jgi:hypothetical protein
MNLTRFEQDGLELFIANDGSVFANIKALARMCNVSRQAISKWQGGNQIPAFSAEVQTEGGLQGGNLLNEKAIGMALIRYNPELAQKCFDAGLRVLLYGISGYQATAATENPKPRLKPLSELSFGELNLLRAALIAKQVGKPIDVSQILHPAYLSASMNAVTYAMWIKELADTKLVIQAAKISNRHIHKDARIPLSELESRQKDLEHSINHDDFSFFREDFEAFHQDLQVLNACLSEDLKALAS